MKKMQLDDPSFRELFDRDAVMPKRLVSGTYAR